MPSFFTKVIQLHYGSTPTDSMEPYLFKRYGAIEFSEIASMLSFSLSSNCSGLVIWIPDGSIILIVTSPNELRLGNLSAPSGMGDLMTLISSLTSSFDILSTLSKHVFKSFTSLLVFRYYRINFILIKHISLSLGNNYCYLNRTADFPILCGSLRNHICR